MKKHTLIILIISSIFLLTNLGCEKDKYPDTGYARVRMTNNSSLETHMWTKGETMGLSNKLAPGASRTKIVKLLYNDADSKPSLFIAAGRNGQVLDLVEREVTGNQVGFWPEEENDDPEAIEEDVLIINCTFIGTFESTGSISFVKKCSL